MITLFENIHVALPEIIILVTACLALLSDLFFKPSFSKYSTLAIACAGLLASALVSYLLLGNYNTVILAGLYVSDDVAQLMKIFIAITVLLSFFYSKDYLFEKEIAYGDYLVLGLFSALGMMVLVSANSFLTIYLGLELLSLPIYAMTAMQRTSGDAIEAAMKYFVMGAIASGMLLYGISLIYGATGQLNLLDVANGIATNWQESNTMIIFALVFIVVGLGFKLAAVPFHMWAPDVYQGAPTSVTLFISAAPKVAAMGMTLRLLAIALPDATDQWQQLILVMALLSTAVGNVLAVVQTNLKRLLAYSAIGHTGYALFGILAGTEAGYSAALYYILVYSVMSVAAFGFLVLLSHKGFDAVNVDDLKGLNKRNPWMALMLMLVMFSMAGVPPMFGFFTKLLVLKALVDVQLTWVAVFGLMFAVVGAYYYIRIVKVMYFEEPSDKTRLSFSRSTTVLYSANCLGLLAMGLFPAALINACISAFAP